nr:phage terminase large subunit [Novosphingobium flavum]
MTWGSIVQSWDTASKDNPHNDWSVCVTALVRDQDVWIVDVFRRRLQIPDLTREAIRLAREWHPRTLLIEDQASGTQLIQNLRAEEPGGVPSPIPRRPEADKQSRTLGVSSMIESGRVLLPEEAPWLADFRGEVQAFPGGRFDDQVDALSQLLEWVRQQLIWRPAPLAGPELVCADDEDDDEGSVGYYPFDDPWA